MKKISIFLQSRYFIIVVVCAIFCSLFVGLFSAWLLNGQEKNNQIYQEATLNSFTLQHKTLYDNRHGELVIVHTFNNDYGHIIKHENNLYLADAYGNNAEIYSYDIESKQKQTIFSLADIDSKYTKNSTANLGISFMKVIGDKLFFGVAEYMNPNLMYYIDLKVDNKKPIFLTDQAAGNITKVDNGYVLHNYMGDAGYASEILHWMNNENEVNRIIQVESLMGDGESVIALGTTEVYIGVHKPTPDYQYNVYEEIYAVNYETGATQVIIPRNLMPKNIKSIFYDNGNLLLGPSPLYVYDLSNNILNQIIVSTLPAEAIYKINSFGNSLACVNDRLTVDVQSQTVVSNYPCRESELKKLVSEKIEQLNLDLGFIYLP